MEKVNFKQVIVMRTDPNCRKGKMIAQGSHASSLFILNRIKNDLPFTDEEKMWMFGLHYSGPEWKFGGMAKICLRVDSYEQTIVYAVLMLKPIGGIRQKYKLEDSDK